MTPTPEQIAAARSVLADIDSKGELDEAFALNVIATAIREAEIRGEADARDEIAAAIRKDAIANPISQEERWQILARVADEIERSDKP